MEIVNCNEKKRTPLIPEKNKSHYNKTNCYICQEEFGDGINQHKARDHCHSTDKYRGSAHSI